MVLTDTIVGFIFIIHLFVPRSPMDDGREAYTRNPVFLCWFNQIKPRNAKNRRTLNRAAPFRSFFVEKKKKKCDPDIFDTLRGFFPAFVD